MSTINGPPPHSSLTPQTSYRYAIADMDCPYEGRMQLRRAPVDTLLVDVKAILADTDVLNSEIDKHAIHTLKMSGHLFRAVRRFSAGGQQIRVKKKEEDPLLENLKS